MADCFWSGVEGAVGGSGVERGCEGYGVDACEIEPWIVGFTEVDAFENAAVFVEFGEELCGFDACITPAIVVDIGWMLGIGGHSGLYGCSEKELAAEIIDELNCVFFNGACVNFECDGACGVIGFDES